MAFGAPDVAEDRRLRRLYDGEPSITEYTDGNVLGGAVKPALETLDGCRCII